MSAIEEPNEFGSAVKAWMTKPEDADTWLNIGYGYWSNRFHSTGIKWADLTVVEVLRVGIGRDEATVKAEALAEAVAAARRDAAKSLTNHGRCENDSIADWLEDHSRTGAA